MRTFAAACVFVVAAVAQEVTLTHGPFRGHVDTKSIHVWARASAPGEFSLELVDVVGDGGKRAFATATAEHDNTLHFVVDGLRAATSFGLRIRNGERVVHKAPRGSWSTAIADDAAAAKIVFGSCAEERRHPEQPIWERILAQKPDALVLLGDTPYIDDGTQAGRQRRHREFFAFEPIANVLAAIPTWTTWDDHDYATNDVFGATKGGDLARSVFVDYHAHAAYGDGTRGIWTSFRRGPLEVFVLDTRTFADTEPSVLAPNERTLLGKAQTEWLQKGLLASSATFKVLACGMVWNGAVRPNKKDCWGNWLGERDALLRWIGANAVKGVVLVSGDVHRSRVVVHPTASLAGYDVPEFVTSPLAQDVIETNKVDVPGLVFDAGEPDSCLALAVANGALTATFLAGDGREFWTRTFDASTLQPGDAAGVYRRVEQLLQTAFGVDYDRLPEQDYDAPGGLTSVSATSGEWRAAVAAAAPALAEWSKAKQFPRCRFAPTGKAPGTPEFFDRIVGLGHLQRLALARGLQALVDGDEATVRATVEDLLWLARHQFDEPTIVAWMFAYGVEGAAVTLVDAGVKRADAVVPALRQSLRDHLAKRPSPAAIAAPAQIESARLLEFTLQEMTKDRGVRGALARTHSDVARRRCVQRMNEELAPLARLDDRNHAEVRAELELRSRAFVEHVRGVLARMKNRTVEDGAKPDDVAELADLLLSLTMPNLVALLDEHVKALARLQAAADAK